MASRVHSVPAIPLLASGAMLAGYAAYRLIDGARARRASRSQSVANPSLEAGEPELADRTSSEFTPEEVPTLRSVAPQFGENDRLRSATPSDWEWLEQTPRVPQRTALVASSLSNEGDRADEHARSLLRIAAPGLLSSSGASSRAPQQLGQNAAGGPMDPGRRVELEVEAELDDEGDRPTLLAFKP